MPIYWLDEEIAFPDPRLAEEHGVVAAGGDLCPERLLFSYSLGIFPWYGPEDPILWHCPSPRAVLLPEQLRVGRSLKKVLAQKPYQIRYDTAFEEVIQACASTRRPDQEGTWILPDMIEAYLALFEQGYAHSAEAYLDGKLVGGLYGVTLGGVLFGESMFSTSSNASKVAFVHLVRALADLGYGLIDAQVPTPLLASFGATEMERDAFLDLLPSMLELEPSMAWPTGEKN